MITINSLVISDDINMKGVERACDALRRDISNTCLETDRAGISIVLVRDEDIDSEQYVVRVRCDGLGERKGKYLAVSAYDALGFIYGIYHISRHFLKVGDFWFWNEQIFEKSEGYEVPDDYLYKSEPFRVRFRGWFINDEVLFDGWKRDEGDTMPWDMAYEALLRCGGNMTIPGTDLNAHIYNSLADDYGLWLTHHHAEPLGAKMFARAYPGLDASFDRHSDLFRGLWREALDAQKDYKVIWNVGFRGQGDRPFWADDPKYDTPAARGRLMSELMLEQYNMIKEHDKNGKCCVNLYGESMELYREGFLSIPEDVIKIWADNGYGKMVSRRQNNHNPRVFALPEEGDRSANGIYYHASFYDLQAAAMMTMLPNSPEFVMEELGEVLSRGADDFWMINCSNIKPHTYYLDLIARIWRGELLPAHGDKQKVQSEVLTFTSDYCRQYYASGAKNHDAEDEVLEKVTGLYRSWPDYTVKYGPNDDDHAGEQFSNHGARVLACSFISNFVKDNPQNTPASSELNWLIKSDTLAEQVRWLMDKYEEGTNGYKEYASRCNAVQKELEDSSHPNGKVLAAQLSDNLTIQVDYHYYSYLGAYHICRSLMCCLESKKTLDEADRLYDTGFVGAFYEAGLAALAFLKGYETMRSHERDEWRNFYKNDCEADIRQSHFVAKSLMSYLRVLGDGPHFYKWQRHFQEGVVGDTVQLILRTREHLTDDELFELMQSSRGVNP